MLSKQDILAKSCAKTQTIAVPEWGGEVNIRTITAAERDKFELQCSESFVNVRARLCSLAICDESGKRLFDDTDVAALGEKDAAPINRIFEAARKLNGFTDEDIEELEKN